MAEVKDAFRNFIECEKNHEIRFAVLEMESCNGMDSQPFTKAECEFKIRETTDKKSLYITVGQMFKDGIKFMKDRIGKKKKKDASQKEALSRITSFYKSKAKNEASLRKVFDMDTVMETDVAVALTEHLLKALSPGQSCILDSKSKFKDPCKCGLKEKATFDKTLIGNKSVWYGHIDVIFSSPKLHVEVSEEDLENEIESLNISGNPPVGESIAEIKKSYADHSMNQAIAQTIVFSCLKQMKDTELSNHMVPNLVISPEKFRIIMYNAKEDVLLCSHSIDLFDSPKKLSSKAIVVIWMVLHYRCFGSKSNEANQEELKKCKSQFRTLVGSKWETYKNDLDYVESGYRKYLKLDKLLSNGENINLFQ